MFFFSVAWHGDGVLSNGTPDLGLILGLGERPVQGTEEEKL